MQTLTREELFCLEGTRSYAQYYHMRQNFESRHCTFCNLDLIRHDVLWEDDHFRVWDTPEEFKRPYLTLQLMVVPKRHVRFPWALRKNERASQAKAEVFVSQNYDLPGGMWFVRFGDMRLNAGTVPHLHWNLWIPKKGYSVVVPLQKDLIHRSKNQSRMTQFAAQYERGVAP